MRPHADGDPGPGRRGILHRLYHGVYAWGHHNIPVEGRWLAAVKACGPCAVLSHYAAAALWELVKWDGRPIDITAPTKHRHPRIHAHRSVNVERTVHKGIPVTPKLRTVIDLARTEDERIVRRALRQARFSEAELAQLPRRIVDLGADPTNSPLEDDALDFVVRHGLERPPEVNRAVPVVDGRRSIRTCGGRNCRSSSRSTVASGTTICSHGATTRCARPSSKPAASA